VVAAAEMAIAGTLGLALELERMPLAEDVGDEALLFAESAGRFLVEVAPEQAVPFERLFMGSPVGAIGAVTERPQLLIRRRGRVMLDLPVAEAAVAWRNG
jgi:phosphoribosylformylglycinamidine synthase